MQQLRTKSAGGQARGSIASNSPVFGSIAGNEPVSSSRATAWSTSALAGAGLPAIAAQTDQLAQAQAAQLEDLQHLDQVDAGRQRQQAADGHHRGPERVEVAVVVAVGDEAQGQGEAGHHQVQP